MLKNLFYKFKTQGGSFRIFIIMLLLLVSLGLIILFILFRNGLFERFFTKSPSKPTEEISKFTSNAKTPPLTTPDEIIIKFKPGADEKIKADLLKTYGLTQKSQLPNTSTIIVSVDPASRDKVLEALKKDINVTYAALNIIAKMQWIPNDTYFGLQWNLKPARTDFENAWDTTKGAGVVVGVIDMGVKDTHYDLVGQTVTGQNFADGVLPANSTDDDGHGTAVSGVIVAIANNGIGSAGAAPEAKVMPLRIANQFNEIDSWSGMEAIYFAVGSGVRILNLSWVTPGADASDLPYLQEAIDYAWANNVIIVAGSGNNGVEPVLYPASGKYVFSVGGTRSDNTKVALANFGLGLDVVAPGEGIYTTLFYPLTGETSTSKMSGTSFATPHVSALAALLLSAKPTLTNQQVVNIILSSAKDLGSPGWDKEFGCGLIDAKTALTLINAPPVTPTCIVSESVTPTPTPISTPTPTPTPGSTATPSPTPIPDTTPPTVSIFSPTSNQQVSGTFNIQANASDNKGVSKVVFKIDGIFLSEDLTSPYTASWNTTTYTNAAHQIEATSVDTSSNFSTPATVSVNVLNSACPATTSVSYIQPTNGATISGFYVFRASANHPSGITKVEFYFNGNLVFTDTTAPYEFFSNTALLPNGAYSLSLKAYNNEGKINNPPAINVNISN